MKELGLVVSTKGRYYTTLPLLLTSVINSTCHPKHLLIYDDNEVKEDLRENPVYNNIFKMFYLLGIEYRVIFGERKGLTYNHLNAIEEMNKLEVKYVVRVDDDVILSPDTIADLYRECSKKNIGAVGCKIFLPDYLMQNTIRQGDKDEEIYNKLDKIDSRDNIQWENTFITKNTIEVEHLNGSCFMYKVEAGLKMKDKFSYYLRKLTPLCFREDTMWTNGILRCGYNVRVLLTTHIWHIPFGGSEKNNFNASKDERIFREEFIPEKKEEEKDPKPIEPILVVNNGLGDHLILRRILNKYTDETEGCKWKTFKIATCYPEVFEDLPYIQISIAEAEYKLSREELDRCNLYKWMADNKWKGSIEEAYEKLFYNIISLF